MYCYEAVSTRGGVEAYTMRKPDAHTVTHVLSMTFEVRWQGDSAIFNRGVSI